MDALQTETLARLRWFDGRPLSAASGLVCAGGKVYIAADDDLRLAIVDAADGVARGLPLLTGRLPHEAAERKRRKPDFEILLRWQGGLLALGSGSGEVLGLPRERAVWLPLPQGRPQPFSLAPLYARLRDCIGSLNLEGALLRGRQLWLLQRGNAGCNGLLRVPAEALEALHRGEALPRLRPQWQAMDLDTLDGHALGFTDACALDARRWLFTAAAEDTADAVQDGPCAGSVLGLADDRGQVLRRWRLPVGLKIEGLDARRWPDGRVSVALVSDADDPALPAQLLRAWLPAL